MTILPSQLITGASAFIPTYAQDVVAVYTQDYTQVFPYARPIKATVKPDSKLMEQPLETGATVVDHRIVLPIEIDLALILSPATYRDTMENIKQLWANGTLLIVQTGSGVYPNQVIQSIPHDQEPDYFNTLIVALKLKEVLFVTPQYEPVPANPANTSTQNRGTISGADPATPAQTEQSSTVLRDWFGGS